MHPLNCACVSCFSVEPGSSINSPPARLYADPLGTRPAGLGEAQRPPAVAAPVADGRARASSTAEDLRKYFDLKEQGAITQEEFDAFKAKLLQS